MDDHILKISLQQNSSLNLKNPGTFLIFVLQCIQRENIHTIELKA